MHPTPPIYKLPPAARRIWAKLLLDQISQPAETQPEAEPQEVKP